MSDDEVTIAEITYTRRVIVYADVAQVAAQNAADRAKHPDLTDFEYVVEWVKTDPHDFLNDLASSGDGYRCEEDYDDVDVSTYGELS